MKTSANGVEGPGLKSRFGRLSTLPPTTAGADLHFVRHGPPEKGRVADNGVSDCVLAVTTLPLPASPYYIGILVWKSINTLINATGWVFFMNAISEIEVDHGVTASAPQIAALKV